MAPRAQAAAERRLRSQKAPADPEMAALAAVTAALKSLNADARCRVLAYAQDRFGGADDRD